MKAAQRKVARLFNEKMLPRLILWIFSFIFILPFYWMLVTSLKSDAELRTLPPTFFPMQPLFEHYVSTVQFIPFFRYMWNSTVIMFFSVIGTIVSNSFIAYGFSRISWRGREAVFVVVIATMFIPFPVLIVALFDIFASLHLINTYLPLILPTYFGSAFSIFMMRQYLLTIPKEISSAGLIDGANEFQIFSRLIFPLMKPVIAVVGIFAALASWNDFLGPLIYLQNQDMYTLPIGLQFFRSQYNVEYPLLMAASTLVVLPVLLVFLCFQRFFVEGITIGAIKG